MTNYFKGGKALVELQLFLFGLEVVEKVAQKPLQVSLYLGKIQSSLFLPAWNSIYHKEPHRKRSPLNVAHRFLGPAQI